MAKWQKKTLKLRADHLWQAKPGYKIFVADRGAVRFDYPGDWVVIPDPKAITFHDKKPPDDDCRLTVTLIRTPPTDWSGLPLVEMIEGLSRQDSRSILTAGPATHVRRDDWEYAWMQLEFIDPHEQRQAYSRYLLGRARDVHCIMTFDFWADDLPRLAPIWNDILKSLQIGKYIADPRRGNFMR